MFPAILMGSMAAMQVVGGIMQQQQLNAAGKVAAKTGKYQEALANNRAASLDIQAGQQRAATQREMMGERQQGALISGRTRALAAASGATLSSPSIVANLADLGNTEDYRVGTVRQRGEQEAVNTEYGAALTRAGGQFERNMGQYQQQVAGQQGQMALTNSLMQGGMTGAAAASAIPKDKPITGLEFGNYNTTPSLLQRESPMFTRYGFGGPK